MERGIKRMRSRSPHRQSSYGGRGSNSDKMVYISNIPYDVRWMELKDLVREKAGDVVYVEMIENMEGKSKGCAVVEFKDADVAKKCVECMHRLQIRDRCIIVKAIRDPERFFKKVRDETGVDFLANRSYSSPVDDDPSRVSENYETYGLSPLFLGRLNVRPPLTNRVFVNNIPPSAGTNKLRDLFSIAGKVMFVELSIDKNGKSKGVAVIEYTHPIEAVQAISMLNNQQYYEKVLSVRMDTLIKKTTPDFIAAGELPPGLKSVGQGLGVNGMPLLDLSQVLGGGASSPVAKMFNSQMGNDLGPITNVGGSMGGVPFLSSQVMSPSSSAKGSGSNFAQPTVGAVTANYGPPMAQTNSQYGNAAGQPGSVDMGAMLGGGANIGAVYSSTPVNGGSARAYRSLPTLFGGSACEMMPTRNVQSSAARFIVIQNLPLDYTWQSLRDRLGSFGEVEHACIVQPGIGRVRFKHSRDAEQAAGTLNGMVVEGRPIAVDLTVGN